MCKLRSTVITTIFKITAIPCHVCQKHSDIYHLCISTSRDKVGYTIPQATQQLTTQRRETIDQLRD